jgi:hypothetical protein
VRNWISWGIASPLPALHRFPAVSMWCTAFHSHTQSRICSSF